MILDERKRMKNTKIQNQQISDVMSGFSRANCVFETRNNKKDLKNEK
jgi:hypothetical protein